MASLHIAIPSEETIRDDGVLGFADDAAHFLEPEDHPNGHRKLQELLGPINDWSKRISKRTRAGAAIAIFMATIFGVMAITFAILNHTADWPAVFYSAPPLLRLPIATNHQSSKEQHKLEICRRYSATVD